MAESSFGEKLKGARKRYTTAGVSGQAFCLRADYKDGLKKRATTWTYFSDYEWENLGDRERLTILFGSRIVTIEGHKLDLLYREIDEGRLKTFEELTSREAQLLSANPDGDVEVISFEVYPTMKDLIAEIKQEREGARNAPKDGFAK
jgi:hypothetical protein